MSWDKLKGRFLVLDGADGSGKTTQLQLLEQVIEKHGLAPFSVRDPGGTRVGEKIRQILLDRNHYEMSVRCEAFLYMASRAQLYSESIKPALDQGKCVLCDRWVSSTYAYQAIAGQIGPDVVLQIVETGLERAWPDLTVIIDLPAELGLQRIEGVPDRMEQKSASFHERVREAFLELARIRPNFYVVDGTGSVQQVHQRVYRVLCDYVDS